LGNSFLETGGSALVDPPTVDSTYGQVFAFQAQAVGGGDAAAFQSNTMDCICVVGTNVVETSFGAAAGFPLHGGDFDNNYFTNGTGYIYVCAVDSGTGFTALRRIAMTTGAMSGTVDPGFLLVANENYAQCSPATEVYNPNIGGGTDYLFFSVQSNSINLTCLIAGSAGCLMEVTLDDTTPFTFPATFTAALPEPGGTSGIIIDNVSTEGQASSIYFTPLANGTSGTCDGVGCAVKATQLGLN
jgi:hypothetical protein